MLNAGSTLPQAGDIDKIRRGIGQSLLLEVFSQLPSHQGANCSAVPNPPCKDELKTLEL